MMTKYISLSIYGTPVQAPSQLPQGSSDTLQKIIQIGISLLLIVAIILGLVYLIFGGVQWIMSRGDKQQLDQAKLKITYAVIGLIISLSGFLIVSIVFNFFHLSFT